MIQKEAVIQPAHVLSEDGRRFVDHGTMLHHFSGSIWVCCAKCQQPSLITDRKLRCLCGHRQSQERSQRYVSVNCPRCSVSFRRKLTIVGNRPYDVTCGCGAISVIEDQWQPRATLGLPLWLTIDTRFGPLWAYNKAHIQWMTAFVAADQRIQAKAASIHYLTDIMPRWSRAAKNRKAMLKALSKLNDQCLKLC